MNGSIETYRRADGMLHRTDGPAKIVTTLGQVSSSEWWENGSLHRVGDPAVVEYQFDGGLDRELYYDRGEPSRLDGPTSIQYFPGALPNRESYFFDGDDVDGVEGLVEAIEQSEEGRLRDSVENSIYAPLLDEHPLSEIRSGIAVGLRGGVTSLSAVREIIGGAPVEWVRAYEESRS